MKGTLRFSPNIGVKGDAGKAGDAGFRSLKGPGEQLFGMHTHAQETWKRTFSRRVRLVRRCCPDWRCAARRPRRKLKIHWCLRGPAMRVHRAES